MRSQSWALEKGKLLLLHVICRESTASGYIVPYFSKHLTDAGWHMQKVMIVIYFEFLK